MLWEKEKGERPKKRIFVFRSNTTKKNQKNKLKITGNCRRKHKKTQYFSSNVGFRASFTRISECFQYKSFCWSWFVHPPTTTHLLTHSPTHPLTHSPTHPLTHSPTHPLTTHPLTHSPTHPLTHSPLTHSPTHPLTHSPTHPLTHSPTHPFTTHPLTRPFTHPGANITADLRELLFLHFQKLGIGGWVRGWVQAPDFCFFFYLFFLQGFTHIQKQGK